MDEKPKLFNNSFHNTAAWVNVGLTDSYAGFNFKPASVTYSASATSSDVAASMFMHVAKPIRLVYEKGGERYHLTLGDGEKDLPLGVSMSTVHTYMSNYASGGLFDPPEILKEIEITLKMRVKHYTVKKIETE